MAKIKMNGRFVDVPVKRPKGRGPQEGTGQPVRGGGVGSTTYKQPPDEARQPGESVGTWWRRLIDKFPMSGTKARTTKGKTRRA